MKEKFEYKTIIAGRGGGLLPSSIEKMKSDGWELDSQNGLKYTFKRKTTISLNNYGK